MPSAGPRFRKRIAYLQPGHLVAMLHIFRIQAFGARRLGAGKSVAVPKTVTGQVHEFGGAQNIANPGIAIARMPWHHRDPFDRLLIAQAQSIPAYLLTTDAALEQYSELVRRIAVKSG